MSELIDAEMMEASTLLSNLGTKRTLELDEELVEFTAVEDHPTRTQHQQTQADGSKDTAPKRNPVRTTTYPRSILCNTTRPAQPPPLGPRDNPHQLPHKNLVEISMILTSDDAASECHRIISHLLTQLIDVDDSVAILPMEPLSSSEPIRAPSQLPTNWTKLGRYIYLKGGAYSFRSRNDHQGHRKHPEPWLVFHLASKKETSHILQSVSIEFERVNGRNIRVKSCQEFDSYTPLMFPFLYNKSHLPSLMAQLRDLLEKVKHQMEQDHLLDDNHIGWSVPEFTLRVNNPRFPSQTTANDKRFDSFTSQNKRIIHLECGETAAPFILHLFNYIKEHGLMRRTFGKYVLVTEPLTKDASGQECALLRRMSQMHTNYHNSVQLHSIIGIINISASTPVRRTGSSSPSNHPSTQSLLEILYGLRLPDGSPLFLTILPRPNGSTIDCVIPNTAAAETRLIQMNRHFPGYLKHYLVELGYHPETVTSIINRACDPDLTATISQLTWDATNKCIILPSETALGLDLDAMAQEPWMQVGPPIPSFHLQSRKNYNDPEHAFPLTSDLSVTTIHEKKKAPSSPTSTSTSDSPNPMSPTKEVVIVDNLPPDDISMLSTMSKGDLVKMLMQLNRNNRQLSGTTGFAPAREMSPHAGPTPTTTPAEPAEGQGTKGCPVAAAMGE